MTHLELDHISKTYGDFTAVDDACLSIDRGEFVSFLGPSGCGKTTLLNVVAGFLEPDSGDIFMGGKNLTRVPPHRRDLGMVFQSYALFPHLTVAKNVAFGLKMKRVPKSEIGPRVKEALQLVQLAHLADRLPKQLSGGQQQRIALARALVVRPQALLLDEPLSNLDARMRVDMRVELRRIQRDLGVTMVFVTHDQEEALTMSDRIVVVNKGRIEQVGTPEDIYERPASLFVATFVGSSNVFDAVVDEVHREGATVVLATGERIGVRLPGEGGLAVGTRGSVVIRPERIGIRPGAALSDSHLEGKVRDISYRGSRKYIFVEHKGRDVVVSVDPNLEDYGTIGSTVTLVPQREDALFFPDEI